MKTKQLLLGLVLCALPLLYSCSKSNANQVTLTAPAKAAAAKSIKPVSGDVICNITYGGRNLSVRRLDFLRDGAYVITADAPAVKSDPVQRIIYSGTYTVNGNTYTLTGAIEGDIIIDGETLSASFIKGSVEVKVEFGDVESGSLKDYLYRTWTLSEVEVNLTKPNARKKFPPFTANKNISEIVTFIDQNITGGLKEKEILMQYDIESISFGEGIVLVTFVNKPAFAGTFDIKGLDGVSGSFSYDLSEVMANNGLLQQKASGSVTFSGNTLKLTLNASTEEVSGSLVLTMAAK